MRILLVEDEPEMAANIRMVLHRHDMVVDHASSLDIAQEAIRGGTHDAILLDRQLPDGDGLALIAFVRKSRRAIPIIVISARASSGDRIAGLDDGADDYLGKPFSIDELVARLRAVMRRGDRVVPEMLTLASIAFDTQSRSVAVGNVPLELPRRELLLLEALMRRPGRTVTKEALQEALYGFDDEVASNTMEAQISRLRRRLLERNSGAEIHNLRGVGYLMRAVS